MISKFKTYPQLTKGDLTVLVASLNLGESNERLADPEEAALMPAWKRSDSRLELRKMVKEWQESGPNLFKLFESNRALQRLCQRNAAIVLPTESGAGQVLWQPPRTKAKLSALENAAFQFTTLITNPYWYMLGGPCPRCNRFFIKKSKKQKIYCSRNCATKETAIAATRRKRAEGRAIKITRAKQLIEEWTKCRGREVNWIQWVSIKGPISKTWLTRAFNKGELAIPPK